MIKNLNKLYLCRLAHFIFHLFNDLGLGQASFVMASFVMPWVGIIIVTGAMFGGDTNQGINNIYWEPDYGVPVPYIITMTKCIQIHAELYPLLED